MKNRIALFTELTLILVVMLFLETILPFTSLLFTNEKELVFMLARMVFIPVVSILFIVYLSKRWRIRLEFKFTDLYNRKLAWVILITVLYFIVIFPFSFPVDFTMDFLSGMIQVPDVKQPDFTDGLSFWLLVHSVIIAPVLEEILFRGIIQRRIERDCSPKISILITSIVFAICHYNPSRFIRTLLCGLLFGVIYHKYKSLGLSIVAHSLINVLVYFTVRIKVPAMNQLVFYSLVFLVCSFSLYLVNKRMKVIE